MDPISQVGIGGIFAVLVIREVFNFLDKRRENDEPDDDWRSHELLETLKTQNKAILRLLDMEEEQSRVIHRVEKTLDRLDQSH